MKLSEANDMNVPVGVSLGVEKNGTCTVTADNYRPRKQDVVAYAFEENFENLEAAKLAVMIHFVPLYATAILNLTTTGELYYWEAK